MSRVYRLAVVAAAVAALSFFAAGPLCAEANPAPAFPTRIVKLGGPIGRPDVTAHLEHSIALGYNAVWLRSSRAGSWWPGETADPPRLHAEFVELARWCDQRGVRLFVELTPVSDAGGLFVFDDRASRKRLRSFMKLLKKRAGVRDLVISYQRAPRRITELRDILRFGTVAATAHLDLAGDLSDRLPRGMRLWLAPSISSNSELDNPRLPYSKVFLRELARLDPAVGIVWSGTQPVSPSIEGQDLVEARARLGGRRLLLEDRYPTNHHGPALAAALVLGPLRNRSADIAPQVEAYLTCPMGELGASRLPLLTIAEFLRAPRSYDPDASWQRALEHLAGDDARALEALRTQATEWGGWVGGLNYRTARTDSPRAAAAALRDPASVASYTWTVKRYPERMAALQGLTDPVFREELLEVMARRLVIARVVPTVRELRARMAAGRQDTGVLVDYLHAERKRVSATPTVLVTLDRFLDAAGVAPLVSSRVDGLLAP